MIATAIARLLQGAERALFSTELAVLRSVQSIITASNRWRVNFRMAPSGSGQCSMPIPRSLSTRRNKRPIFSSEHSTNDFKLIGQFPTPGSETVAKGLAVVRAFFLFLLRVQEVGHIAQLFGRGL